MKKIFLLWLLACLCRMHASAHHIIGGEMYYKYLGRNGDQVSYQILLKLYRGCEPVDRNHADFDPTIRFTIFNKDNLSDISMTNDIALYDRQQISRSYTDPCIVNPPTPCYQVGYYHVTISLPVNKQGYVIAYQRCCRSDLIVNANTQSEVGATYYTEVPGTENGIIGTSSRVFNKEEAILICANSRFQYDYSVGKMDNSDSVAYEFAPAYEGGSRGDATQPPATPPPYPTLYYYDPYSYAAPLGAEVSIDPKTGIISGKAPPAGIYVVAVKAVVYRDGKKIAEHRKDFHIEVTDCHRQVEASIPEKFNNCEGYTISFPNSSTTGKPLVWDFGDGNTSAEYTPSHTYKDTGTYQVLLRVDPSSSCGDSAKADVRIYPPVKAQFTSSGSCLSRPVVFTDRSTNTYGKIDSWHWDFGDPAATDDTANIADPPFGYRSPGVYTPSLTITTTKGCEQTFTEKITVYDKPPLSVTGDTLLCYKDSLRLQAQSLSPGQYTWTPSYHLLGNDRADPVVYPGADTTYYVSFTDRQGCVNTDSVHLKIVRRIIASASPDTTICRGDPLTLHAESNGEFTYDWYDSGNRLLGQGKDFLLQPLQSEVYTMRASLGSCFATAVAAARVAPYPTASAGEDTSICYGDRILLHGSGGSFFQWSGDSLSDPAIAAPLVHPLRSTAYVITVTDTLGCPKAVSDTMLVRVVPPVQAFAGRDTIITEGEIFQLHATGGTRYTWSPPDGLSNAFVADPLVRRNSDIRYLVKVQSDEGCSGYDSIYIKYMTGPEIYVPTAFTPNGDGRNDVFRPIQAGVTELEFFRVFNRWGRLMYETKGYLQGWNGSFHGEPANSGTYVWIVKGKDFNGRTIFKKGTVILIR